MTASPEASVVVPTRDRLSLLPACLDSLAAQQGIPFEVIVVDDGADARVVELVGRYPGFTYLPGAGRGPAAARNRGVELARAEIVAFTDDDCTVPPDWLALLLRGYRDFPHVTGVGGTLRAPEAILRNNGLALHEAFVSREIYGAGESPVEGGFDCPAGGTNNMSYLRQALRDVGGFCERFPLAAGEDADLKWRLAERGARFLYVPVAVTHLRPYTWRDFLQQHRQRGVGAAYFERERRGRFPSRRRIALRLFKRWLRLPVELSRGVPALMAALNLVAGVMDCWGQWSAGTHEAEGQPA